MKLARNMMNFTTFAAVSEAQRLAEASGLNLQDLGKLVRYTDSLTEGPGAVIIRGNTEELTPEDPNYESMLRTRDEGEHDLAQALDLARSHSIDVPLAAAALEHLATGLGVPHRGRH
jgi:3-hydroxyisobutyrate dehydrogenase-like beta-hydroxyacid dehydrogenase